MAQSKTNHLQAKVVLSLGVMLLFFCGNLLLNLLETLTS